MTDVRGVRVREFKPRRPMLTRFMEKVDPFGPGGCWLWTGARTYDGYARLAMRGQTSVAHRAAYELFVGPIPDGLQLDHLCRVRHCVNPTHLEAVTGTENTRRGLASWVSAELQRAKTHCPKGHPYDGENTYVNRNGSRQCRTCIRSRRRKPSAPLSSPPEPTPEQEVGR